MHLDNLIVIEVSGEESALIEWRKMLIDYNISTLTGYNIQNFDIKYMWDRATALGCGVKFRTGIVIITYLL